MIYAIRAVDAAFVKFGKAGDPVRRLAAHQVSCPFELKLIAVAEWPDIEESLIHLYLEADKERGEWFRSSPAVDRIIGLLRDGELGLREWHRVRQAHRGNSTSIVRRLAMLKESWHG